MQYKKWFCCTVILQIFVAGVEQNETSLQEEEEEMEVSEDEERAPQRTKEIEYSFREYIRK